MLLKSIIPKIYFRALLIGSKVKPNLFEHIDGNKLEQHIDDAVLHNKSSTNCKNYGFSSIDDKVLQKNIDESFLDALEDVGEVGFQEQVKKWTDKRERDVQRHEMLYQEKLQKSTNQSSNEDDDATEDTVLLLLL